MGSRFLSVAGRRTAAGRDETTALDAGVQHMLYSFSKAISATAIVLAHQRKLIDYDAPIHAYIPEYRGGYKDATTIRHLLTHSAGIPNCPIGAVYTPEEWRTGIEACCAAPVEWEPGSKTEYHGTSAMFLAAEATRHALGMATWEEVCRELVFEPLGAKSLTFRVPEAAPLAVTPQPKELPAALDSTSFKMLGHPGAGCFGRLEDVLRVLELHLNGGLWHGRALIAADELREMHRVQYEAQIALAQKNGAKPAHLPWGLGWMIRRHLSTDHWFGLGHIASPRTFGHAGIDTLIGIGEPDRRTAMVFVTTGAPNPSGPNTARIRNTVTDLVMGDIEPT